MDDHPPVPTPETLTAELAARDITLMELADGRLSATPASLLTDADIATIRILKEELMAYLAAQVVEPTAPCSTCGCRTYGQIDAGWTCVCCAGLDLTDPTITTTITVPAGTTTGETA